MGVLLSVSLNLQAQPHPRLDPATHEGGVEQQTPARGQTWDWILGIVLIGCASGWFLQQSISLAQTPIVNPFARPVRRFFGSRQTPSQPSAIPDVNLDPSDLSLATQPVTDSPPSDGAMDLRHRAGLPPAESFIYAAAHDLQEPLRKLKGQINRLEPLIEGALPETGRAEMQSMRRTAQRMQSLLDSLLSLSKIQGRGARFGAVNLGEVLKDAQSNLEMSLLETQAEISIEGTPPTLEADAIQLLQLFQNLISNALKFHAPGRKPRVQIRMNQMEGVKADSLQPPADACCEIQIQDDGIGFDLSEWEGMVMGFHRQHGRERFEGTGLGLAICRTIVERHGGTMTAISHPGKGATIILRLPMVQKARGGDTAWIPSPCSAETVTTPNRCF